MTPLRVIRIVFFSNKRRCVSLLVIVILLLVSLLIVGRQNRFVAYIFARTLHTTRYSSKELEAMIPIQDDGRDIILHPRKSDHHWSEEGAHRNLTSYDNHFVEDNLFPSTMACRPIDPKVLFFVRIPKCASTSFVEQLKVWSKLGQFELFFHPSGAFDWDIRTIKKVASQVNAKKSKRFVYARHFYYTDFRIYGVEDYSYLTIIRDPISRFVSSYLYYHYSSKAHIQAILNPVHKNETLIDCIEHQHEGCAHNWLTKYFCGHDRFCKLGNEQALRIAKENILRDFAVVGIFEEMEESVALFRELLPGYFSSSQGDRLPMMNKNERSLQLSTKEEEAVRSVNLADIELYNFVRTLFYKTVKACKLT